MRRIHLLLSLTLLITTLAIGQAPRTLNYQGVLTTDGVTPVTDGNYTITFNLYNVASGGSTMWTEIHATVPVSNGEFAVVLGESTALALDFNEQLWLGITVDPDPEMTPRVQLTASPYAMGLALPYAATQADGTSSLFSIENTGFMPAATFTNSGGGSALELNETANGFALDVNWTAAGSRNAVDISYNGSAMGLYSAVEAGATGSAAGFDIYDGTSTSPVITANTTGLGEGLITNSSVVIGNNTTTDQAGEIRFNGSSFEGYNGATWNQLDGASGVSNLYSDGTNIGIGVPTPYAQFHVDSIAHIITDGGDFLLGSNIYSNGGVPTYARNGAFGSFISLSASNGRFEYMATSVAGTAGADATSDLPGNSLFTLFPNGNGGIVGAFQVGVEPTASPSGGMIQFTGSEFQGYDGSSWVPLGSGFSSPIIDDGNDLVIGSSTAFLDGGASDQSMTVMSTSAQASFIVSSHNAQASQLLLLSSSTGGTQTTPAATQTSDDLGTIAFSGYNSSFANYNPNAATISAQATEAWTGASNIGTKLTFSVVENGTATAKTMTLDNTGYLGIGTATPGANIHVEGTTAAPGLYINQTNTGAGGVAVDLPAGSTNTAFSASVNGASALGLDLDNSAASSTTAIIRNTGGSGEALRLEGSSGSIPLVANSTDASGNIAEFEASGSPVASIDVNGKGSFSGGLETNIITYSVAIINTGTVITTTSSFVQLDTGFTGPISINAGVNGQVMYIYNNTGGAIDLTVIDATLNNVIDQQTLKIIYVNSAWRLLNY